MRGCPNWPAEPRTIQGVPTPTGDGVPPGWAFIGLLSGSPATGLTGACAEVLQGTSSRACWPRKGVNRP
jgi:hypothetical protein